MTITNIILTNQRRPYKLELQHLQHLSFTVVRYHYRSCVRIISLVKCKKSFQIFKKVIRKQCCLFYLLLPRSRLCAVWSQWWASGLSISTERGGDVPPAKCWGYHRPSGTRRAQERSERMHI